MSQFDSKKSVCGPVEGLLTSKTADLTSVSLDTRFRILYQLGKGIFVSDACAGEQAAKLALAEYAKASNVDTLSKEIEGAISRGEAQLKPTSNSDGETRIGLYLAPTEERPRLNFSTLLARDGEGANGNYATGAYNPDDRTIYLPLEPSQFPSKVKLNCDYKHEFAHFSGETELGAYKISAKCEPEFKQTLRRHGQSDMETNILAHIVTGSEHRSYVSSLLDLDGGKLTPRVLDLLPGSDGYRKLVSQRYEEMGIDAQTDSERWMELTLRESRDGFVDYFEKKMAPGTNLNDRIASGQQQRMESAADALFNEALRLTNTP